MNEISSLGSQPITVLNIESNKLQMREKIDQFIQKNYTVFISNVDHLDEAQIICLGETHTNERHRQVNGEIVDMLYEDESILLVEESSEEINEESSLLRENEIVKEQAKYVTKSIKIQGWDIQYDENNKKELHEFVVASRIYENPRTTHFVNPSKIKRLHKDLKNNQVSTCSRIASLFSLICTLGCAALFVKSCRPCIKKYYKNKGWQGLQKIINEIPERNQRMRKRIEDYLLCKKIFVMAGGNHFDFVEQRLEGIDYGPADKAVEEIIHFLETKKFAILIPDNDD